MASTELPQPLVDQLEELASGLSNPITYLLAFRGSDGTLNFSIPNSDEACYAILERLRFMVDERARQRRAKEKGPTLHRPSPADINRLKGPGGRNGMGAGG